MKNLFLISLCFSIAFSAKGQDTSPYKLRWSVDLPVFIAGAGLSYAGLQILRDKPYLDSAKVASLKQSDINRFDRGATRHYDAHASTLADISLFASFASP